MISFIWLTISIIDFLWIVMAFENNINTAYSISTLIPVWNHWKFNLEIRVKHSHNDTNQVSKNMFGMKTLVDKWTIPMNSKSSNSTVKTNYVSHVIFPVINHNNTYSKVIEYPTSFSCDSFIKSRQTLVDKWTIPINSKSTIKTNYVSDDILPVINHKNICTTVYPTYFSCNSLLKNKQVKISKESKFTYDKPSINMKMWYNTNLKKNERFTTQYCTSFKYWPVRKSLTRLRKPINYKIIGTKQYINIAKYSNQMKTDRYWHVTTNELL